MKRIVGVSCIALTLIMLAAIFLPSSPLRVWYVKHVGSERAEAFAKDLPVMFPSATDAQIAFQELDCESVRTARHHKVTGSRVKRHVCKTITAYIMTSPYEYRAVNLKPEPPYPTIDEYPISPETNALIEAWKKEHAAWEANPYETDPAKVTAWEIIQAPEIMTPSFVSQGNIKGSTSQYDVYLCTYRLNTGQATPDMPNNAKEKWLLSCGLESYLGSATPEQLLSLDDMTLPDGKSVDQLMKDGQMPFVVVYVA